MTHTLLALSLQVLIIGCVEGRLQTRILAGRDTTHLSPDQNAAQSGEDTRWRSAHPLAKSTRLLSHSINPGKTFDYDLGNGPRFPRVSPGALADPRAPFDPGKGNTVDPNVKMSWQPADTLSISLSHIRSHLFRLDTKRVAYDQQLYSCKTTYQFTRFTFARARVDYDTLRSNIKEEFLAGWSPNPGTSVYAGYNDDLYYNGFSPLTGRYESGLRRNTRTLFIVVAYLFRIDS